MFSNEAVTSTLWNDQAVKFNHFGEPVVLIKDGKIVEYQGGKSISVDGRTVIQYNPDTPRSHSLRTWFENGGGRYIRNKISAQKCEWLSIKEADFNNQGNVDEPHCAHRFHF